MRSASLIASSMSWVTNTIVLRSRRLEVEQLVLQAGAHDRVDRAERLVHQQDRRVGGQRPGHADPLLLAARQLGRVARAAARGRGRPGPPARRRAPRSGALSQPSRSGHRGDVLGDGAVGEEADALDDVADAAPQLVPGPGA